MSARDAVLGSVRRAVAGARPPDHPVPRNYRSAALEDDPIELFAHRVADYRAKVVRCTAADVEETIKSEAAGLPLVAPPGLSWQVDGITLDAGLTATELDGFAGVVTTATLGIAITGTIVLDHGPGQGRRALTLIPDLHICIVQTDQIVPTVPEAIALLDPSRPQTWISGPSATSDIELSRVEGVHGPRTLVVILVDGAPAI